MKHNIFKIMAMAAVVLLTACSETDDNEIRQKGREINFTTEISQDWYGNDDGTRGTPVKTVSGMENFTSYCYYADSNAPLYENMKTSKTGTLETKTLWPEDKQLKFFAIHPHDATKANFNYSNDTFTYNYTVNETPTKQKDLMYATSGTISDDGAANAPIHFKHALTAVTLRFKDKPVFTELNAGTINSITLKNIYTTGTYTLPTGKTSNTNDNVGTWSNLGNPRNFTFSGSNSIKDPSIKNLNEKNYNSTYRTINPDNQTLLMIPQPLDNVSVEINFTVYGLNFTLSAPLYHEQVPAWEQGKTQTYIIGSTAIIYPVFFGTHNDPDVGPTVKEPTD